MFNINPIIHNLPSGAITLPALPNSEDNNNQFNILDQATVSKLPDIVIAEPEIDWNNREAVLQALILNVDVLKSAPPEIRADREIILAAIRIDGRAILFADKSLAGDKELIMIALTNCDRQTLSGEIFSRLPSNLRQDPDVIMAFFNPPAELKERYQAAIAKLIEYGIEFLERFHGAGIEELEEIVDNRADLEPDGRPLAVLVYTKSDHNDAFENNRILELMNRGYRVVYFEADNEAALYAAVQECGAEQPIDLLIIGGHGTPESTALGSTPIVIEIRTEGENADLGGDRSSTEEAMIDLSDETEVQALASFLAEDSVVVLESCSTAGGEEGSNIRSMFARALPQSQVIAPAEDAWVVAYQYDQDNRITDVIYNYESEQMNSHFLMLKLNLM